jgi:hypothetical protein
MVKITGAGVMATPVAFPPLNRKADEQYKILRVRDALDYQNSAAAAELAKLRSLSTGIKVDLLTGRVLVPKTLALEGTCP